MKLEQAARQALEALIKANHFHDYEDEITALREALSEQAEQEPVGKIVLGQYEVPYIDWTSGVKVEDGMKLYAAPVRTKDLTDDEKLELARSSVGKSRHWLVEAAIAADREKNK